MSVAVVLALAIAALGAAGGLAPVEAAGTPSAVSSLTPWTATLDVGPATVEVLNAVAVRDLEPNGPFIDAEKERFFAVVLNVTVTDDRTWNGASDLVRVEGLPGVTSNEAGSIVLLRDASDVWQLQPGLPEKVGYLWRQSNAVPVPATVTVLLQCGERVDYELFPYHFWTSWQPCARVVVPVEDRTVAGTPTP